MFTRDAGVKPALRPVQKQPADQKNFGRCMAKRANVATRWRAPFRGLNFILAHGMMESRHCADRGRILV
jgi:hypothetical protein